VRLTIARYYTPTGRSIQRSYKDGSDAYSEEFDHRLRNGEFYKKDSIKQDKTRQYKTPNGKTVYGGGGIVPDLFVPLPVAQGSEEVIYLMESGLVSYFAFEQIDRNRNAFSKLDYNQFLRKMEKETKIVQQFQKYAEANGAIIQLEPYKEIAKKYLIAEFARQLFEEQDYFTIILKEDPMIKVVMDQVK
jgi:carboxyl-terminal processing protease